MSHASAPAKRLERGGQRRSRAIETPHHAREPDDRFRIAQHEADCRPRPYLAVGPRQLRADDFFVDGVEHGAYASEAQAESMSLGGDGGAFHINRESAGPCSRVALGSAVFENPARRSGWGRLRT